jgi:hypothetical protein
LQLTKGDPVAWHANVLVVANRTAGSDELIEAMKRRASGGPTAFTLLMPAGPGAHEDARPRLEEALAKMRAAGLEVVGKLGIDANPLFCVGEVWDASLYDEIVVSTFSTGVSHWLNLDMPQRVARLTDAPVEHVVAHSESQVPA